MKEKKEKKRKGFALFEITTKSEFQKQKWASLYDSWLDLITAGFDVFGITKNPND